MSSDIAEAVPKCPTMTISLRLANGGFVEVKHTWPETDEGIASAVKHMDEIACGAATHAFVESPKGTEGHLFIDENNNVFVNGESVKVDCE